MGTCPAGVRVGRPSYSVFKGNSFQKEEGSKQPSGVWSPCPHPIHMGRGLSQGGRACCLHNLHPPLRTLMEPLPTGTVSSDWL